jgi:hypothetical protein
MAPVNLSATGKANVREKQHFMVATANLPLPTCGLRCNLVWTGSDRLTRFRNCPVVFLLKESYGSTPLNLQGLVKIFT